MPSPFRVTPDRAVLAGMLITAAAYCRDLQYDFILDDVSSILVNETITSWKNWATLFVPPIVHAQGMDAVAVHYRPVYMLWFMANYHLFGMVLPWWHLTSLLLHLLVVLLVYAVGMKVLRQPWTAALAALLFTFHPIHVETVAYLSASTDLLAAVFLLLAFLAYSHFREQRASFWYLMASLLAAALAMLSKETAAVLPLILLAYELLREQQPGEEGWGKRLVWTLPFFGLVLAYAGVRRLGNLGPGPGAGRLSALLDVPLVLLTYLRSLLWPVQLSFYYPVEWSSQWTIAKGLAVVLILAAWVLLWRRYKDSGVRLQLLWMAILFIIPLSCVFAFRKEDWVHDRHMYLVSIPFCLAAAVVLTDRKLPRRASIVASSLLAGTLLIITAVNVPRFTDELSVYQSALKVAPRNILLRRYYVAALWNQVPEVREPSALRDKALREFQVNIELGPQLELDYINYATALDRAGFYAEAAVQYEKALQMDPGQPSHLRATILYRLAGVDLRLSKLQEAERGLREALAIDTLPGYHGLLAEVLRQRGLLQEAAEQQRLEAGVMEQFVGHRSAPTGAQRRPTAAP